MNLETRLKKCISGHIPIIGYLEILESTGKNLREKSSDSLISHYRESISREIINLRYLEARKFFLSCDIVTIEI